MNPPEHSNTSFEAVKREDSLQKEERLVDSIQTKKTGRRRKAFWLILMLLLVFGLVGFWVWQRYLVPPPGRTNFLILGVAGSNHAGSDLTDTMIFLSVDHRSGRASAVSLPRDIWVPELRTKLNSVYHYRGIEGVLQAVQNITGQKIDHYFLVDFDFLVEAVDLLGGVEIDVRQGFDDYRYPIAGKENDPCDGDPEYACRYEHLHFEKGKQAMSGEVALKFVRSRFAEGEEGTDFARSQRQQLLLQAIKRKALSRQILFDLQRIDRLFDLVGQKTQTNIQKNDYLKLISLLIRFRSEKMETLVLNDGYLVNPPPSTTKYDGQWVLVPSTGDWQEVHRFINLLLAGEG